jgi:hypothetical protein
MEQQNFKETINVFLLFLLVTFMNSMKKVKLEKSLLIAFNQNKKEGKQ